jgi:DNA-binding MarR family transcriptional regulator
MPFLVTKVLPRYDCLVQAAKKFPDLDPTACEAFFHLLRAGHEIAHRCESAFASHNLSEGRFAVLMQLLDKGEDRPVARTPAELAERVGVTRATMTGLIDTLERDGLAIRAADPNDRRMMSVQLTARGHEVLKEVLPAHFKLIAEIMSPLSDSDRQTLTRLMTKVLRSDESRLSRQ